MTQPDNALSQAILGAAKQIQRLEPGSLAELRRMDAEHVAPAFWRLAAHYPDTIGQSSNQGIWIAIVRLIAILTPKGDPGKRSSLHDSKRPLGAVLCDGGDPAWPPPSSEKPRPALSERRLIQLLAARGSQREVLLTRVARAVARSRATDSGVNLVELALVLLKPTDGRLLAAPYYRRLDSAERTTDQPEGGTTP